MFLLDPGRIEPARGSLVFFVGAGASYGRPSALPLFADVQRAILAGLDRRLQPRLLNVAPESLLRSLRVARLPVEELVLRVFAAADARPNAVHYALAHRAISGDVVWTTNYDTLIEDAISELASDRYVLQQALGRVRKPHGTFVRDSAGEWTGARGLIFEADQVLIEWPDPVGDLLAHDVRGRTVVLFGYSGVDVNSYRALRHALRQAEAVNWFWYSDDGSAPRAMRDAQFRFPELPDTAFRWSSSPSEDFLAAFLGGLGLKSSSPLAPADLVCPPPPGGTRADLALLTRAVSVPRVQAVIARELGERSTERQLLNQALLDGMRAVGDRLLLIRHDWPISSMRSAGRALLRRLPARFPATARARARALADLPETQVRSMAAMARRAARWAARARTPVYRARLLLDVSRVERTRGNFDLALRASREALELACTDRTPLTTEAARAELEQIESQRYLGHLDSALESLRMRYHTLGMTHWAYWMEYEHGVIALQLRDFIEAAEHLARARAFFDSIKDPRETAYSPRQGQRYVALAQLAVNRCTAPHDLTEQDARKALAPKALTGPVLTSLSRFQLGELARSHGDWNRALHHYALVNPSCENHEGLALLGRSFAWWGSGDMARASQLSGDAAAYFAQQSSVLGLAYVSVLEAHFPGTLASTPQPLQSEARKLRDRIFGTPLSSVATPELQIAFA